MDAEELQVFFNLGNKKSKSAKDKRDTSVILSVSGRTYPLEICYSIGKDDGRYTWHLKLND